MPLAITSPVLEHGGTIPTRHSRDGENLSPPLEWHGAPRDTRSFVLVVDDPDAPSGTFFHWAMYDISSDTARLPEGAGRKHVQARQGVNGFGNARYDGPQPPKGHGSYHYCFRLTALNVPRLDLGASAKVEEVWAASSRHIIEKTKLENLYKR